MHYYLACLKVMLKDWKRSSIYFFVLLGFIILALDGVFSTSEKIEVEISSVFYKQTLYGSQLFANIENVGVVKIPSGSLVSKNDSIEVLKKRTMFLNRIYYVFNKASQSMGSTKKKYNGQVLN